MEQEKEKNKIEPLSLLEKFPKCRSPSPKDTPKAIRKNTGKENSNFQQAPFAQRKFNSSRKVLKIERDLY